MKAKEITDEFVTEMTENVMSAYTNPPASFYAVEDLIWDWLMYTVKEDELDRCNNVYDVCSLFLKEYPEW